MVATDVGATTPFDGEDVPHLVPHPVDPHHNTAHVNGGADVTERPSDVFARMASYTSGKHNPLRRVALEWSGLTYTVTVGHFRRKRPKQVLCDVWGAVQPGRLLAVMGPSGSGVLAPTVVNNCTNLSTGKTSVINALAGRLPRGGHLDGSITINGQPRTKAFRNISAYVLQNDILLSCLTVRETFTTAAQLRLPSSISKAERNAVVDQLLTELGLSDVADTYVGMQRCHR